MICRSAIFANEKKISPLWLNKYNPICKFRREDTNSIYTTERKALVLGTAILFV